MNPGLSRPGSGREITRRHSWSVVRDNCFTSDLGALLRPSALPKYQGLKQSLLLLAQKVQLPEQELVWGRELRVRNMLSEQGVTLHQAK